MNPEVVVVGQVCADIVARPVPSFTFNRDTTRVESIVVRNGGDGLNAAIGMSRLGTHCAIMAAVGDDPFGRVIIDAASGAGVDTSAVRVRADASSPIAITLVDASGDRVFVYNGGAMDRFSIEDVDQGLLARGRFVHVGGVYNLPGLEPQGLTEILRLAKELGKITSMDVTWDASGTWLPTIAPSLPYLDYFLPSYQEARAITGQERPEQAARFLRERGVGTAVVKLGKEGCYLQSARGERRLPACGVRNVVDTTGAGDAFVAGFLSGLARGWDVESAARLGNAAGALAVSAVGATTGLTSFEEAMRVMEEQQRSEGEES